MFYSKTLTPVKGFNLAIGVTPSSNDFRLLTANFFDKKFTSVAHQCLEGTIAKFMFAQKLSDSDWIIVDNTFPYITPTRNLSGLRL